VWCQQHLPLLPLTIATMSETWHRILAEHPLALSAAVTAVAGTVAYVNSPHYKAWLAFIFVWIVLTGKQLRHIPSVGSSSWPLLSYLGAKRYFANALQYYQEGYDRVRSCRCHTGHRADVSHNSIMEGCSRSLRWSSISVVGFRASRIPPRLIVFAVMVTGRTLIRELAALPDDTMSFPEAIQEVSSPKEAVYVFTDCRKFRSRSRSMC
jgi:hypothetical protein